MKIWLRIYKFRRKFCIFRQKNKPNSFFYLIRTSTSDSLQGKANPRIISTKELFAKVDAPKVHKLIGTFFRFPIGKTNSKKFFKKFTQKLTRFFFYQTHILLKSNTAWQRPWQQLFPGEYFGYEKMKETILFGKKWSEKIPRKKSKGIFR